IKDETPMTKSCATGTERFRISSFGFTSAFVIRASSFYSSFHIPDGCKSHDRFANSRLLRRGDYFVDVFVSGAGFLGEALPGSAANVNAARFQIALELSAMPLFARFGPAHRASAAVGGA